MFNRTPNNICNNIVLQRIREKNMLSDYNTLKVLKNIAPSIPDEDLLEIYKKSISIHQKNVQGNGSFLENDIVKEFLDRTGVDYRSQVSIDKQGIIFGFNQRKSKCYHNLDFVVGKDIAVDRNIRDFTVLSCKTTCRERWTQDNWTYQIPPRKYILITLSDDYPSSMRFREGEYRKIVTCNPKVKDDRNYKLGFEDIFSEIS